MIRKIQLEWYSYTANCCEEKNILVNNFYLTVPQKQVYLKIEFLLIQVVIFKNV